MICYKKASAYDSTNQRILTDLAALQVQSKRFEDFRVTRSALWLLNQDKANCVAFAVSLFLNKEFAECLRFVDENLLAITKKDNGLKWKITDNVELDQVYLLKARILTKMAKWKEALSLVEAAMGKKQIRDRVQGLQLKVDICEQLGMFADASDFALKLVEDNPENANYLRLYLRLKGHVSDGGAGVDEMA